MTHQFRSSEIPEARPKSAQGEDGGRIEKGAENASAGIRRMIHEMTIEGCFLTRYDADSVIDAVRENPNAAEEFVHSLGSGKFSFLSSLEMKRVTLSAISHFGAALFLIHDLRHLVPVFKEQDWSEILLRAVVSHEELQSDLSWVLGRRPTEWDNEIPFAKYLISAIKMLQCNKSKDPPLLI